MAYKLDQDNSSSQSTSWFAQQFSSIIKGSTWLESLTFWKLSNVLGWYLSNYLALKTQLMVGFERKINMLYKYEWYMTAPTKTLLNGETKIDLDKTKKLVPKLTHTALLFTSLGTSHSVEAAEKQVKAAAETKRIAGGTTETHGTHTMTVTLGNSTESIVVGNKNIMATVVIIDGKTGIALSSGAGSIAISTASVAISGPLINLG